MNARPIALDLLPKQIPNPDGGDPLIEDRNRYSRIALILMVEAGIAETKGTNAGYVRMPLLVDALRQATGVAHYDGITKLVTVFGAEKGGLIEGPPPVIDQQTQSMKPNRADVYRLTQLGQEVYAELKILLAQMEERDVPLGDLEDKQEGKPAKKPPAKDTKKAAAAAKKPPKPPAKNAPKKPASRPPARVLQTPETKFVPDPNEASQE